MILTENKHQDIFIFSRDSKGNPTTEHITDFKPYFYSQHPGGEYKTIDGKKARKIIVASPEIVKTEREKYAETYESDILYPNRYIIDRLGIVDKVPIRICYLDIETARTEYGFEDPVKANNPILSITVYDNFNKAYRQWWVSESTSEKNLLEYFIRYIKWTNPDMLVAWNGDGFDFPLLINRIKKVGLNPNRLSRGGKTKAFKTTNKVITKCYGRVLFDLMHAYKKMHSYSGRESWALDYISKYEGLGGKEEYKGELDELFKKDIDKFIAYNKRDVELLVLLNEKLGIIDFFDKVRRLCCCQFVDVFMNSKMADCLCLRYARKHRFVLPRAMTRPKETFQGGFVHSSEPKLHKNICVMDMKSLYPSIMIGFNVSYETLLPTKEEGCINLDDEYFFKRTPGIIPSIVKPILEKRKEVTKQMKGMDKESLEYKSMWQTQYALKVIANSFYGVLGFRMFRLYNNKVASAVTYAARKIIKEVHKWFEDRELKVVYGDTDSVFIEMGDKSVEDLTQLNRDINIYFRKYFLEFGVLEENNIFKLEFEKIYKTILFKQKADGLGVKKKYAGKIIWEEGKVVDKFSITGFESKRSDSPQIGRDLMRNVLKMICDEKTKEEIDKYVCEFKEKIRTEFTAEQIALPIGLSKSVSSYKNVPIHIRATKLANEKHNAQIQSGDKIKYIYVKGENNVIAFKSEKWMWDGYEIDYDQMIRRIVDLKIGPLYEGLGWDYPYLQITKKKVNSNDTLKQEELW